MASWPASSSSAEGWAAAPRDARNIPALLRSDVLGASRRKSATILPPREQRARCWRREASLNKNSERTPQRTYGLYYSILQTICTIYSTALAYIPYTTIPWNTTRVQQAVAPHRSTPPAPPATSTSPRPAPCRTAAQAGERSRARGPPCWGCCRSPRSSAAPRRCECPARWRGAAARRRVRPVPGEGEGKGGGEGEGKGEVKGKRVRLR